MKIKTNQANSLLGNENEEIITWGENYATGIELIDNQHKELVHLTNSLYRACLAGSDAIDSVFKSALSKMVEYVRFHFTSELELLRKINYPEYRDHKKQHDTLILKILEASKNYCTGRQFVPYNFVRALKDWVFGHIAFSDKAYADYIREQKSKGLLTDEQITG